MREQESFQTPPPNIKDLEKEYRHLKYNKKKRISDQNAPLPDIQRFGELQEALGEDIVKKIDAEFKD